MGDVAVITEPAVEPVDLTEIKRHLNIDSGFTLDDTWFNTNIGVVRRYVERQAGLIFRLTTLEYRLDAWPSDRLIDLPAGVADSVTHVNHVLDGASTETTFAASNYETSLGLRPSQIRIKEGSSLPALSRDAIRPLRIRFVAGYDGIAAVPTEMKLGLMMAIGHRYRDREGTMTGLPPGVMDMLRHHARPEERYEWLC